MLLKSESRCLTGVISCSKTDCYEESRPAPWAYCSDNFVLVEAAGAVPDSRNRRNKTCGRLLLESLLHKKQEQSAGQ
jgi:hypothetical protein